MKPTTEDIVLKLFKNIDISKAAGIDTLLGRFLKDAAVILAKPVLQNNYENQKTQYKITKTKRLDTK